MSVVEDGLRSTPNFAAQARRITAYARGQLTNEAAELLLARTHAALEDAYRDGRLSTQQNDNYLSDLARDTK